MDSQELTCLLKSDNLVKKKFTNKIYCYDTLPRRLQRGKFYIANTRSSKSNFQEEAGHWILYLFYANSNKLVFIDPFGLFPIKKFILPMLRSGNKNTSFFYNNLQLQNFSTTTCGQHVLMIATLFGHNYDILSIFNDFYKVNDHVGNSNNFKYDEIVNHFLLKHFHETRGIFWDDF